MYRLNWLLVSFLSHVNKKKHHSSHLLWSRVYTSATSCADEQHVVGNKQHVVRNKLLVAGNMFLVRATILLTATLRWCTRGLSGTISAIRSWNGRDGWPRSVKTDKKSRITCSKNGQFGSMRSRFRIGSLTRSHQLSNYKITNSMTNCILAYIYTCVTHRYEKQQCSSRSATGLWHQCFWIPPQWLAGFQTSTSGDGCDPLWRASRRSAKDKHHVISSRVTR